MITLGNRSVVGVVGRWVIWSPKPLREIIFSGEIVCSQALPRVGGRTSLRVGTGDYDQSSSSFCFWSQLSPEHPSRQLDSYRHKVQDHLGSTRMLFECTIS